jgi:hypothetical protein
LTKRKLVFFFIEEELDEEMREGVEKSARHLYGLIHARFIITSRGLAKMVYKNCYFFELLLYKITNEIFLNLPYEFTPCLKYLLA